MTSREGTFFALWLIQTLCVVKYPLLTLGNAPQQGVCTVTSLVGILLLLGDTATEDSTDAVESQRREYSENIAMSHESGAKKQRPYTDARANNTLQT